MTEHEEHFSADILRAAADFLQTFDESRYPADFLADYEPLECLGASAWCETMLVKDRRTGEAAVAKCYPLQTVGKQSEGELLRRLKSPALPTFLAEYRNETLVCVVRAFIEGVTLGEAARKESFTRDAVLDIGVQLCKILSDLHMQTPPVIHRDIKPDNLILQPDGRLVLIDFGISRVFDQTARTDTQFLGTQSFAPPEQYGFSQTDSRSDIFSLGMVLGFLLTKSADLTRIRTGIPDRGLSRIINRCTAFSPEDRYRSAQQVERALCAQMPKRRLRRALLFCAAGLLCMAAAALLYPRLCARAAGDAQTAAQAPAETAAAQEAPMDASGVSFDEPLLERAVRAVLGKSATDPLTKEDLLHVDRLYVFGNTPCASADAFYAAANDWYAAAEWQLGSIFSLSDVRQLPNLRELCVAAQGIDDLSPLAALPLLEKAELKHNRIREISVLSELPALASVGLNDNPVTDLSPLAACKSLRFLDLCDVQGYDPSFLSQLGDFEFLDLANPTDSYAYLGSRGVRQLKLGYTALDSLSYLSGVTGLESLEVKHSKLTSLAGVEAHAGLTELNIAGCAITDLSPLAALQKLQTLTISEDMRPALEAFGPCPFTVIFE